jgi:hypothetical protein
MNDSGDRDSLDFALALTRSELTPAAADKARLRAALGLTAGVVSGTGALAAAAPALPAPAAAELAGPARVAPSAALRASGKLGASLAVALFGAGVATGWALHSRGPEASGAHAGEWAPVAARAVAAAAPLGTALPPAELPAAVAAGVAGAPAVPQEPGAAHPDASVQRARGHAAAVRAHSAAQPLNAELALLRRVERALRNGDPALARALLTELDEDYPQTRLAEERLAARTIADCRLAQPSAAAHAQAFLSEHRASVYSERVHSACAPEMTAGASAR